MKPQRIEQTFTTHIDSLDEHDGQSLIIVLGECRLPEGVDTGRVVQLPDAGPESVRVIGGMNMFEYRHGIDLLVASSLIEAQFDGIWLIQKILMFCFVKFIWFPGQDTATPDPLGVGGDKGPFAYLVYQLHIMVNLPYLMSYPRARDLEGSAPSAPVLLLAPGPSLNDLAPHLNDLSERFITVCLSRALVFCKEHGVVPDIVVQLDTHGEQQNFYPPDMDFSKSWLFALSCAPIHKYAHRFAGIFWIDTFETEAYGDGYEMRNSWLSSLIPMLGVAEMFRPPKLLVAGADLGYATDKYFNGTGKSFGRPRTMTKREQVEAVGPKQFPVILNDGAIGETHRQFMATAFEAETIASELMRTSLIYSLTPAGLLDPNLFPYAPPESFLDMPKLYRPAIVKVLDTVAKNGQLPDEKLIKHLLRGKLKTAEILARDVDILAVSAEPKDLEGSPVLSAGKIIYRLHQDYSVENLFHLSRRVIHKYRTAVHSRFLLFRFNDWIAMGKTIPLYCYPHEKEALEAQLTKRFPGAKWEIRLTWSDSTCPMPNRVFVRELPNRLSKDPVSLMTRRYADAADYLLDVIRPASYLIVEDLLQAPWPGIKDRT